MGEICRYRGFKVTTFSTDHDPPHVHVIKNNWEIRIALSEAIEEVSFMSVKRGKPSTRDVKQAIALVQLHLDECWKEWGRIHDNP